MTESAPQSRVQSIRNPATLQVLSHPTRLEMLEALREPGTAAAVGRKSGSRASA